MWSVTTSAFPRRGTTDRITYRFEEEQKEQAGYAWFSWHRRDQNTEQAAHYPIEGQQQSGVDKVQDGNANESYAEVGWVIWPFGIV